jgi:predicted AlkP superfamily pyrophosphatase or phosphodiesterase
MKKRRFIAILAALACFAARNASADPQSARRALLLVSIDGMRPDYVMAAQGHGLAIPHLRAMLHNGAYATGVRGVLPTVTYPSHTTILTGVWPSRHGIYLNETFDPLNKNLGGWYWYSEDIRVPTLWDAAARAGLTVASVSWPVSVATPSVRYLIPEVWRAGTPDDLKLLRALSTPGLVAALQEKLGAYVVNLDEALQGDRQRTRYAAAIIREKHPDFVTVHLAALDHLEHETGPFSPESNATLEQIDQMVGDLADAMRAARPNSAVCVVSDHGFTRTNHHLHIFVPFVEEGLITVDQKTIDWPEPRILSWKATPWIAGGSAAIVLKDPNDSAIKEQVERLLRRLANDPANGIANVLDRQAIENQGGASNAEFWIDMNSNFMLDHSIHFPLVTETKVGGSHGYSPNNPELMASFMIAGPGVKERVNIGEIDMRSIAPTLAGYLGVPLPGADLAALPLLQ